MKKVFFENADMLAAIFTPEQQCKNGIITDGPDAGLKPIEAFATDIMNNLVCWACENNCVFYQTEKHWYMFESVSVDDHNNIITMTRFDNHSWKRLDHWANPHSLECVGKDFLKKHTDKRVPVVHSS